MEPVLSKKDFVRRYIAGEFGNAAPTWNDLDEYKTAMPWSVYKLGYHQRYHIRNREAGGPGEYNVCWKQVGADWHYLKTYRGCKDLYISAMAPTERTIIQGEVQQGVWGWELTYSLVRKPMREALAETTLTARGLGARLLLREAMNDLSYQWLEHLLGEYPDHVVEFSVYSTCWGTVPGHNTVFWEVRYGY